jgi:hypothetical protein
VVERATSFAGGKLPYTSGNCLTTLKGQRGKIEHDARCVYQPLE